MIIKKLISFKKKLKKKKLDLHTPYFQELDFSYLKQCIKSTFVSTQSGSFIKRFKSEIIKITNSKYVVLTNSGSSAIYLALRALNIKKNNEVLLTSLNYIANANAVKSLNAIPHFIDSDINYLGIDFEKLKIYLKNNFKVIKKKTVNIKTGNTVSCLIATHIFGISNNINELVNICKKYNLKLIEDASEALGSKYKGRHLGTFGNIGILSFNGNKIITSGAGGALMTNNLNIYKKSEHLSQNAKKNHKWKYEYDDLGYNIKMPNLNAALGFAQIKRLKKYINNKKKLFKVYKKLFSDEESLKILTPPTNMSWNYWLITILLKGENLSLREKLLRQLNLNNINARSIWQLNHKISMYKKCPRMNLSNAEKLEKKIINLPSSAHLLAND